MGICKQHARELFTRHGPTNLLSRFIGINVWLMKSKATWTIVDPFSCRPKFMTGCRCPCVYAFYQEKKGCASPHRLTRAQKRSLKHVTRNFQGSNGPRRLSEQFALTPRPLQPKSKGHTRKTPHRLDQPIRMSGWDPSVRVLYPFRESVYSV